MTSEHKPIELSSLTKWRAIYKTLLNLLVGLIVLAALTALTVIIVRQGDNGGTLRDVKQSNHILVDCTTPGHPCYEKEQAQTARVLGKIKGLFEVAAARAAACAPDYVSLPQPARTNAIYECITKGPGK